MLRPLGELEPALNAKFNKVIPVGPSHPPSLMLPTVMSVLTHMPVWCISLLMQKKTKNKNRNTHNDDHHHSPVLIFLIIMRVHSGVCVFSSLFLVPVILD